MSAVEPKYVDEIPDGNSRRWANVVKQARPDKWLHVPDVGSSYVTSLRRQYPQCLFETRASSAGRPGYCDVYIKLVTPDDLPNDVRRRKRHNAPGGYLGWTPEREAQLAEWANHGVTTEAMAQVTGRTERAIEQRLYHLGYRRSNVTGRWEQRYALDDTYGDPLNTEDFE